MHDYTNLGKYLYYNYIKLIFNTLSTNKSEVSIPHEFIFPPK